MPIPSSPSGIPNQVPAQSSALAQAEKTPNPSLGTPFHPIITAPPTTNAPFSLPNLPKSIPINGAMINAQQSQANLIAQQNFAADNVKLDDGTYISKADFDKLSPTDQASLMKLGVSGFNAQQTANQQAFLANSVKLDDGEYVSKASFNALSPSDQASLMSLGISKFNAQQPQSSSGGSSVPIVPVTQATKDQYASLGKQINDLQTVV
ncbi:MAG TPA: hypothetical protein VMQ58_02345, partial [Candidatus Saccharimonadales bacterium]|nr:hypothetical protein [Candidatus Saccharimonadales bacterium]